MMRWQKSRAPSTCCDDLTILLAPCQNMLLRPRSASFEFLTDDLLHATTTTTALLCSALDDDLSHDHAQLHRRTWINSFQQLLHTRVIKYRNNLKWKSNEWRGCWMKTEKCAKVNRRHCHREAANGKNVTNTRRTRCLFILDALRCLLLDKQSKTVGRLCGLMRPIYRSHAQTIKATVCFILPHK